jgi:hypothetical protein
MKLDPNTLCPRFEQRLGWAVVHDLLVHPLLPLSGYARWAVWLHDWTSAKAWRRKA